jgi:heparanase
MKKSLIIVISVIIVLLVMVISLALWNANGSILDVITGQFEPEPKSLEKDISLKGGQSQSAYNTTVKVDLSKPVATVSKQYLSFAIDLSQVVGGKWWNPNASSTETGSGTVHAPIFDFNRKKLDVLASGLAPAYLSIGGSESDKAYYDLISNPGQPTAPPKGYQSVMTAKEWDDVNGFARRNGLQVTFTLNTGPSARKSDGSWDGTNAAGLLAYSAQHGYPIAVWGLGNELNIFWFVHGLKAQVPIAQYDKDLKAARALVKQYEPEARFAGQGSAFWPVLGEPLSLFYGYMPYYLKQSGSLTDHVSWHYYPQQSRRGPIASRRAYPSRLLDPKNLDEAGYWADKVRNWRDLYAPGKPIWLAETGNAQFGGEPGLSDVYLSGLWWMDELGILARKGHEVVVRQTLSGMDYGMINDGDLNPRPDYWNSLMWKHLMGSQVYSVQASGENSDRLRVYAQASAADETKSVSVLLINIDPQRDATVSFPGFENSGFDVYQVNAPDIFGSKVLLNNNELALTADNTLPEIHGESQRSQGIPNVTVHPLSYTFVTFPIR